MTERHVISAQTGIITCCNTLYQQRSVCNTTCHYSLHAAHGRLLQHIILAIPYTPHCVLVYTAYNTRPHVKTQYIGNTLYARVSLYLKCEEGGAPLCIIQGEIHHHNLGKPFKVCPFTFKTETDHGHWCYVKFMGKKENVTSITES